MSLKKKREGELVMSYLDTIEFLCESGMHPARTIARTQEKTGKNLIGCVPYHTPDEIIYASGAIPVGLWGGKPEFSKADKYLQSFCCGILRAIVEYSANGTYDILKAIVVPTFCDSMKCALENLKLSSSQNLKIIGMGYGQQRKLKTGQEYTISEYKRIKHEMEKLQASVITDEMIKAAFYVYEKYRLTMSRFEEVASKHLDRITSFKRAMIIKAGLYMDKAEYTDLVQEIIDGLRSEGEDRFDGKRVIVTGIMAEPSEILHFFDEEGLRIAGDEMSLGSRIWRTPARKNVEDVYMKIALRFADAKADPFMFEPEKLRGWYIQELVRKYNADAVIVMMMKFCDPEQYDYPIYKTEIEGAQIPMLYLETDQQTIGLEQIRTRIQSFAETLLT